MVNGFLQVHEKLGSDFYTLFPALLIDRGTEFSDETSFESKHETGEILTRLFYCDPMQSSQRSQIEKTYSDLKEKLDLACSHVNAKPRESLNGKTSYEAFEFLYNKKILDKLNILKIAKDDVTLHLSLVK